MNLHPLQYKSQGLCPVKRMKTSMYWPLVENNDRDNVMLLLHRLRRHPQNTINGIFQKRSTYGTRGTPRVQLANIRKMVLCQGLLTSMRWPMHGTSCLKSQLKSTCLTAKFGRFLDHAETGEKGQNVISSSVQHPISLIFEIHVSFIIPLNDVGFVDKAYAEICDHSLFTLQFR